MGRMLDLDPLLFALKDDCVLADHLARAGRLDLYPPLFARGSGQGQGRFAGGIFFVDVVRLFDADGDLWKEGLAKARDSFDAKSSTPAKIGGKQDGDQSGGLLDGLEIFRAVARCADDKGGAPLACGL